MDRGGEEVTQDMRGAFDVHLDGGTKPVRASFPERRSPGIVFGRGSAATARDAGDDDVAAACFHASEGGSDRPGMRFDLENRDGTEAKRRWP